MASPPSNTSNPIQAGFVDAPDAFTYSTQNGVQAFILTSAQVAAVKAYVLAGLELPQTADEFNQRFPPAAWQIEDPNNPGHNIDMSITINDVVEQIPDVVQNVMLHIYADCEAFSPQLSALLTLTARIVNFCEILDAISSQIPNNLKILTNPKSSRAQIRDAQAICSYSFGQIIPYFNTLITSCDPVLAILSGFQGSTIADKALVDPLFARVFVDQTNNPSIQTVLSSDIAQRQTDIAQQQANMASDIQKVVDDACATALGLSVSWIFPWGTLVSSLVDIGLGAVPQLVENVKGYQASEAAIVHDNQQIALAQNCLDWIHQVHAQGKSIKHEIGGVIKAVREMQSSFADMITGFNYAATEIAAADPDAMASNTAIRQLTEGALESAISKWGEIRGLAQVYIDNSTLNWSTELPPPSASA